MQIYEIKCVCVVHRYLALSHEQQQHHHQHHSPAATGGEKRGCSTAEFSRSVPNLPPRLTPLFSLIPSPSSERIMRLLWMMAPLTSTSHADRHWQGWLRIWRFALVRNWLRLVDLSECFHLEKIYIYTLSMRNVICQILPPRQCFANMADEDLSDEQLRQLLKDAEERLKNSRNGQLTQAQNASLSILQKRYHPSLTS